MDKLIQRVVGLSPARRSALQRDLKERANAASRHAIPVLENRREVPLSFAQQRLWFLDQLAPGSTAYNIAGAVRLIGPLNVAAMEQSLGEILWRHVWRSFGYLGCSGW